MPQHTPGGLSRRDPQGLGLPPPQLEDLAGSMAAAAKTESRESDPRAALRELRVGAVIPVPANPLSALSWSPEPGESLKRLTPWAWRLLSVRVNPGAGIHLLDEHHSANPVPLVTGVVAVVAIMTLLQP